MSAMSFETNGQKLLAKCASAMVVVAVYGAAALAALYLVH